MDRAEEHCVKCGVSHPKTETTYTLIERHGWRLSVTVDSEARKKPELWCPSCWAEHHGNLSSAPPSSRRLSLQRSDPPSR
jgi:hypothetical protein